MDNEYNEYETFIVTTKDGTEAELAIVDRFKVGDLFYVAASKVEGDTISEEGVYIYKSVKNGDDTDYIQITDPDEYSKVADAYAAME